MHGLNANPEIFGINPKTCNPKIISLMKKFTTLICLMIISSSILFAQNHTQEQIARKNKKVKAIKPTQTFVEIDTEAKTNPNATTFTDDLFGEHFQFLCGDGSGEAGIETNGQYIYTSKWNGEGFFCYEIDGTFLGWFDVPGTAGVRDMAYDGTYFYGAAASTALYEMDFIGQSGTLISTLTAAVATRACAYDSEYDAFYGNNWSDPITLFDRSGGILNQFCCGQYASYYGFAYVAPNDDGPWLYGFAQDGGASQAVIVQIDPVAGYETGVVFDAIGYSTTGTGSAGGLAEYFGLVPGRGTLIGIIQNETIFGVEYSLTNPFFNDLKLTKIIEPNTGINLGIENVVIKVENYGLNMQSDFEVKHRVDGSEWISETISTALAYEDYIIFTFNQPYDFSAIGEYYIEAKVILEGDENPLNNTKQKFVENQVLNYCEASTNTEDEWIANVSMGLIDNSSGWQGGVADYTDQVNPLFPGIPEEIIVTNGNPWASDAVSVWVDWNDDFIFDNEVGSTEKFDLTNDGTGSVSLAGTVVTNNANLSFFSPIVITDTVAINTGSGAGNITIAETLDGTVAGSQSITFTAGTGDITCSEPLGGITRLGNAVVVSAHDVNLSDLIALSIAQQNGTGTIPFLDEKLRIFVLK